MFAKLLVTALILWTNLNLSIGQDSSANGDVYAGSNNETELEQSIDWEHEAIVVVRWKIQNPPIVEYDKLQFDIHFSVSDYIEAGRHVRYDMYHNTECGNLEDIITDADGYMKTWVTEDNTPVGPGIHEDIRKTITVSNKLNSQTISQSKSYNEKATENGNVATITYCVRFSLWNGKGPWDPEATEINHMAVTVGLSLDLNDNFSITGQNVEAKARNAENSEDQFFIEAFVCDKTGRPPTLVAPLQQGEVVRICVQPTEPAADVGFRVQRIDTFTFEQNATSQEAVSEGEVASNGSTMISCQPGAKQCFFETILFAQFFETLLPVLGNGIATLQWGGEGIDRRLQQQQVSATVKRDFDEDYTIKEQDEKDYGRILRDRSSKKSIQIPTFAIIQAEDGSQRPRLKADIPATVKTTNSLVIVLIVLMAMMFIVLLLLLVYAYYFRRKVWEHKLQHEKEQQQQQQNHGKSLSLPSPGEEDVSLVAVEDNDDDDNDNDNDNEAYKDEDDENHHEWKLSIIPEDRTIISSARSILSRAL